ncbi:16S rRNA (uracil(1498)-N(3))-methyltransferase [candidate division TA06 bacterium]|uniref:Ribosomal RNA small subunit methyltransferase E n=1 Tax=candidate division TA06 bacterium TaxID=2250710 RepID=A0A933MJW6_UNCT6|nr:16S rRNA (uracil(1498)-N(3))-methyltransferase [candidate division TA06 bacterium]
MAEYFYAPPENVSERQIIITGEEARHIAKALRHKKGDLLTIVDGQGGEYLCSIAAAAEHTVTANIVNKLRKSHEPIAKVTLAQAVPKGQRMDFAVEKGTELGLYAIVPLITKNSVARPGEGDKQLPPLSDEEGPGHKTARWQRIAAAAMKQSLRSVLPRISQPEDFKDLMQRHKEYDLILLADEGQQKISVASVFKGLAKQPRTVLCLAGPEGGFTPEERGLAQKYNAHIVTLGPRRLRAETAGIVLSTLVLAQLGELGG